jgi:hypothetical protein
MLPNLGNRDGLEFRDMLGGKPHLVSVVMQSVNNVGNIVDSNSLTEQISRFCHVFHLLLC